MSFFQQDDPPRPAAVADRPRPRSERQARYSRRQSLAVAEIGAIPVVANPERRKSCELDLMKFLQTYFPESTGLSPFSVDHGRVISRLQQCILTGGRFANAVYRGFSKTTIAENAAIWATLYGHRRYVPIIGADETAASDNIESIKRELEENDLLFEDFPEVCFPVRALEGKHQRCDSQICDGKRTYIKWTAERIVLPTIEGSKASGAIITAKGITGGLRGMKKKTADGTNLRPDFIICDDLQTEESASTPGGIRKRMKILMKSVLRLCGHRKKLAIVVNGTVIQEGDLMDFLTDPEKAPTWQSERIRFVDKWADAHDTLWEKYREIRHAFDNKIPNDKERAEAEATAFYVANRAAMDAGCVVRWDSCFEPDTEVSAIQHAYNIFLDDGPEMFASEMQQQPMREETQAVVELTAEQIAGKLNRHPQGMVPVECPTLVGYIDVQQEALFWVVSAWGAGFTGAVVDYGVYPDQKKSDFTLKGLRHKLSDVHKGGGLEATLYAGLTQLASQLAAREWPRMGGGGLRIRRLLVDEGFQTPVIFQFCRQSPHAAILMPAKGVGIGAKRAPMKEWAKRDGETRGPYFRVGRGNVDRGIPHAVIDTNFWKSFLHARLAVPMGAPGCLTLYGDDPRRHELFASHLLGEFRKTVSAEGRTVDEWEEYPDKRDQHWFDCLTGSAAAAAMEGVRLSEWGASDTQPRRTFTLPGA